MFEAPRFPAVEQLVGQIYPLCRDQHGCRYLQKKLEEGKEEYVDIILNEVAEHLLELMSGRKLEKLGSCFDHVPNFFLFLSSCDLLGVDQILLATTCARSCLCLPTSSSGHSLRRLSPTALWMCR